MSMTEIVKVFGERKIRSVWDDTAEEWYFSVVDVARADVSADPVHPLAQGGAVQDLDGEGGGGVAKNARLEIEKKTGQKVISPLNAADAGALDVDDGPASLPEK